MYEFRFAKIDRTGKDGSNPGFFVDFLEKLRKTDAVNQLKTLKIGKLLIFSPSSKDYSIFKNS